MKVTDEEVEALLAEYKQPDLRDVPLDLIPALSDSEGPSFGSSV